MLSHAEWMAKREAEQARAAKADRRFVIWTIIVAAPFAVLLGLAVNVLLERAWPTPTATTRALCDDAMARLMRAETVVELEREKFLVESMRCGVEWRLETLRPSPSVP
jgi:hypothetical protein